MKIETGEKICAFYASDYHFEMIILPYIKKSIEENKRIIILSENELKKSIETVISKINLDNEIKEKILNIDWSANDLNKFKQINKAVNDEEKLVIFIKGKENYVTNVNKNIEKWTNGNVKIIDCYDINEVNSKSKEVVIKYDKVLGTLGEKQIEII